MGDVLVFDPSKDFQVLEEFEFDELITRPEAVRFFTLGEQTTDLLEKLLPKTGKLTKAALRKVEDEVDSFKSLYSKILRETPTGFEEVEDLRPTSLPWVTYANTHPAAVTPYGWGQTWLPLYEPDRGLLPNYYVQLLDSLPKSAIFFPEGEPNVVYPARVTGTVPGRGGVGSRLTGRNTERTETVIALPDVTYTKTAYREDGTFRIQTVSRPDTHDAATFTGYTIQPPNPQPPSPLDGHPFLSLQDTPITVETTEPLPAILPSLDAIFEHAVPRTTNPYKDAPPFLKLYDIRLSDVPWNLWKQKFPPVDLVESPAPPLEIPFKVGEEDAPAKVLLDVYGSPWYPGYAARKWLSQQLDGGGLVAKLLLSRAGTLGPIAVPPPITLPEAQPIAGTPEDCLPSYITEFEDFASRGIYRTPKCATCGFYGHSSTDCDDRKGPVKQDYKPGHGCLPLALVVAEREETPYTGKRAWTPGTDTSVLTDYQKLIAQYTEKVVDIFAKPPDAPLPAPPNETREFIIAILEDEDRTDDDKAVDIAVLMDDTEHTLDRHIYKSADTQQFLICEHTLERLRGEYTKDPTAYLKKWTVVDGFRVCQFCGEKVSDIIQDQDEFDENGRVINRKSKLGGPTFMSDEHLTFAASLKKLQTLFNLNSPGEDVFYLLLSLLQVLPSEDQLKPILDFVKRETDKVNVKIAGKKLTPKQQGDINLALAIFGFSGVVILLQSHRPQLIPRRSFGGKPMVLRGFPRDTEDTADAPLVDGLLSALAQTFERYPTTFRGSSVILLRNVLNDRKSIRKVILSSLSKQFAPFFKPKLQKAKDLLQKVDVSYALHNSYQPPIVRPTKDVEYLSPTGTVVDKQPPVYRCEQTQPPWLTPSTPYSFRQQILTVTVPLRPSSKAEPVVSTEEPPAQYVPTADEVRGLLKRKVPTFKPLQRLLEFSSPEFLRSMLLEWMVIVGQRGAHEYIRERRPQVERATGDPSLLRDYFKGVATEFVTLILGDVPLITELERAMTEDLTVRSLLAKADESKRIADTLRAKERETFKERMRRLPDAQREMKKQLIDLGIAPYLITKSDRETFLKELQEELEAREAAVPDENTFAEGQEEPAEDVPDEGLNTERDVGPQGEVPEVDGRELEYDYGDYGDARARNADGEEYNENRAYDEDEGYGF
jgi:hypothetical protein